MSLSLGQKIKTYLNLNEVESRMLFVLYYDNETIYRFLANDNYEENGHSEVTIDGNVYQCAYIQRGQRSESSSGDIESIEIKLSNNWQSWAAILANQGNNFNGKRAEIYEWFPDFPDEKPILLYSGFLDKVSMTVSEFKLSLVRSLGSYEVDSPNMCFDPICQYTFKDCRCKYKGAYLECGKTLEDCINRNNAENFGGHLSVPRELVIK